MEEKTLVQKLQDIKGEGGGGGGGGGGPTDESRTLNTSRGLKFPGQSFPGQGQSIVTNSLMK